MNIRKILENIDYTGKFDDIEVSNISYDSRKATKQSMFIAIEGQDYDGHDYIPQAIKNGAVAVVKEKGYNKIFEAIDIEVENTREILPEIAKNFYSDPSSKIDTVGVTGTNGKTTTAFLINKILNDCDYNSGSIGTLGFVSSNAVVSTGFTTPESLELNNFIDQLVKGGMENVVIEVSSHSLALSRMNHIKIDTAIFTNLTEEHLDFHKTMENYFLEKLKLFTSLTKDSFSIINIDDSYSDRIIRATRSNVLTYGLSKKADIYLVSSKIGYGGMNLTLSINDKEYKVCTKITGRHNIYNIMAAISACKIKNISINRIISAIENIDFIPGRMEFVGDEKNKIFIDYAHTPDAYENILKLINEIKEPKDKIITLFGCGGDRDKDKRPLMAKITEKYSDQIIVTSDNPRNEGLSYILEDILSGFKKKKHEVIQNREDAIKKSINILNEDSVLLILGKGREEYQIINNEKIFHSDLEIIKREINAN